jgi:Tfp pilus assembly protein PilN
VLTVVLLALSVAGALLAFAHVQRNTDDNERAKNDVEQMQSRIRQLNGEGEKVQQQLAPEQRGMLIAAHKLVDTKNFGWSRLFADLEGVMPGSVSASRISVENVYNDNGRIKAELDFGVLARDYPAVMSMIDSMNNSGVFQAELRGQDRQQSESITYSEYTLKLIYTPTYSAPEAPANDIAVNSPGGAQ